MPLPVVTDDELDDFSHDETAQFTSDQKENAIEQAGDLLWIATGYDDNPDDDTPEGKRAARLVKYGIMDMAWSLLVQTANKTEIYSPFSSERIGSYSYSKASKLISESGQSGVDWFDRLLLWLGNNGLDSTKVVITSYSSEQVIGQPFAEYEGLVHDPLVDYFGA